MSVLPSAVVVKTIDPSKNPSIDLVTGAYARVLYHIVISIASISPNLTITPTAVDGNTLTPIVITDGVEVTLENCNWKNLAFADASSYSIYVSYTATTYSDDQSYRQALAFAAVRVRIINYPTVTVSNPPTNYALEIGGNLAAIKAQTDKLTFHAGNALFTTTT